VFAVLQRWEEGRKADLVKKLGAEQAVLDYTNKGPAVVGRTFARKWRGKVTWQGIVFLLLLVVQNKRLQL
jgi:hypothetical protein